MANQVLKDALAEFITARCCDPDTASGDEHNVVVYVNRRYASHELEFLSKKVAEVKKRVAEARQLLQNLSKIEEALLAAKDAFAVLADEASMAAEVCPDLNDAWNDGGVGREAGKKVRAAVALLNGKEIKEDGS